MALTKCRECGGQISDKAASCPHCGAPVNTPKPQPVKVVEQPPKSSHSPWFIGIIVVSIILFGMMSGFLPEEESASSNSSGYKSSAPKQAQKAKRPLSDEEKEKQKQRLDFIDELKEKQIIHKIEKLSKYPHVFVDPAFYQLTIDQKSSLMNVILTYYWTEDNSAIYVLLYDSQTGKQIGTQSMSGLKMR